MVYEQRRVVVTGMGAITPVGNDPDTMWGNLIAGKSGIGPITLFDASNFNVRFAGEVKDFNPQDYMEHREIRRSDRYTHFATAATVQAMRQANLQMEEEDPRRVGMVIGTGIGGIRIRSACTTTKAPSTTTTSWSSRRPTTPSCSATPNP